MKIKMMIYLLHVWKGASINIDEEKIQRYLNEIKNVFSELRIEVKLLRLRKHLIVRAMTL
jgi:hypothetical protein